MRLSEEEIDAIRQKADIVEIVGHYLPLNKKGRLFKAVCPFHDDHDPSLTVNPERQIYKCWACGAGGNVFGFVSNYEHIGFVDAVVKVAELISYPISIQDYERPQDKHEYLYKPMREAIHYMTYQLNASAGQQAKQYLHERGLDDDIIARFEIGYNPDNDALYTFLHAKGYADQPLVSTNLVRLSENGIHDVFGGRVCFPIHDTLGNPIAFSARSMDRNAPSKYINTTETEIYTKGNVVYNYHRAKEEARKAGRIIVCEGVMDVIALARAGIYNAVATLGTACTPTQIRLLKQICNHIVFCYDGDSAGQNATYKAVKLAYAGGVSQVSIIENKTGLDPDEIIARYGKDELVAMCGKEMSWVEFLFSFLTTRFDLNNYSARKEFTTIMMKEIEQLQDDFDRQSAMHQLSQLTGYKATSLPKTRTEDQKLVRRGTATAARDGLDVAENLVLSQMLVSQEAVQQFKQDLGFLLNETKQHTAMLIIDAYRGEEEIDIARLMDKADNEAVSALILELSTSEMYPKVYEQAAFDGAIRRIRTTMIEEKIKQLKEKYNTISNPDSKLIILRELQEVQRELRRYIDD